MNFFIFCEMDKKAAVLLDGRLVQQIWDERGAQLTET